MSVGNNLILLGMILGPVYAGVGYLVVEQFKNTRKIDGIVEALDQHWPDVDVKEEVPHIKT